MTDQFNDDERQGAATSTEAAVDAATGSDTDPLIVLTRERDALQDRLLRTAAEFDNYRKRVDRDRRDQADFAMADALADLLPIMDNLDLALAAMAGDEATPYRKGIELIHQQMTDLLRKRGVKAIEAVGTAFDPNFHQAVIHEVSPAHREGEVISELRRGYVLGDRLLRPSMVKVAKA